MSSSSWLTSTTPPQRTSISAHGNSVITTLILDASSETGKLKRIITASDDHTINVYTSSDGEWKIQYTLEGHDGGVWCLAKYENYLVSGSTDRSVRIWDLEEGKCVSKFVGHWGTVRCIAVTVFPEKGDEKVFIVTGSRDHKCGVWRLPKFGEGEEGYFGEDVAEESEIQKALDDNPYLVRIWDGHDHVVRDVAVEGRSAVSGGYDTKVAFWDVVSGECYHVLEGHTSKVYAVALDLARRQIYSAAMDDTVRIWDTSEGICKHVLQGHTSLVAALRVTPSHLVSGSADGTVRVWDPENGTLRRVLRDESAELEHGGLPAITCFSADDEKVITGSDGGVRLWDIQTGGRRELTGKLGAWKVECVGSEIVVGSSRDGLTHLDILMT